MAKKPTYEELEQKVKELEKKTFEGERKQAEEKYRGFFENSTDFVYTLDLKGNFTDVNKAAEYLTGYTKKELIGMNYRDYAAADSHEKIFQGFRRIFEEGELLQDFALEVTLKDGAKKYFETSVSPLRKGRKIIGFHGSSRDITRRVHSEQALKRSEERYRTILEDIEEAYFEVDITGNFTFFNDSLSKILGYSNDELAEMNNREYMPPESSKKIYDLFNEIYKTGNPIKKVVYEIIRKDGGHGFHELSASLMKDQTGRPIGFRGITHDITDLKKAEAALRESEERYRTLVDNLPVAVYRNTPGPKGAFLTANPAFCNMFGFKNEEEVKKVATADLYENPKERKEYSDNLIQKGVLKDFERTLLKKDGTPVHTSITSRVVYGKNGKVSHFDSIMLDISE